MKKYSFKTRERRENDNKIVKFFESAEVLLTSEQFIIAFRGYVEDFARYKRAGERKFSRSTEYAAIGIMDINDLYQEAYLAFLEAYARYKETSDEFEGGGAAWSFIKKTAILNFERGIRGVKDGIRTPDRAYFESRNTNILTNIFGNLEEVFRDNVEEVALTKWETDLVGAFMDVKMDDVLDLKANGSRNLKGIERDVLKLSFGLDTPRIPLKQIASIYRVSESTVRVIKNRALNKLKDEKSKEEIADFLFEYRINTQADAEKFRK